MASTLLVGAPSVAAAMFLILQLDHPIIGLMRLSIERCGRRPCKWTVTSRQQLCATLEITRDLN